MRVLTVRQPYAWAIIHGGKDVENRVRNLAGSYRGPVAVHAGLTGADFDSKHPDLWPFGERHVGGYILGVVDLVDVHEDTGPGPYDAHDAVCCESEWAESGYFHLVLANPRAVEPIPYTGALGLRTITDVEVLKKLEVER